MTVPRPYHPYAPISALAAALTAYDEGRLDDDEIIDLLQYLVNAGLNDDEIIDLLYLVDSRLAWSVLGCFGRLADDLIGRADDLIAAGDVSLRP
jgi:hypothetical protein